MKQYSLLKGLGKGLISLVALAGAFIAFAGFSDVTIQDLIVEHVFPLLGGLTAGGAITVLVNWLKFYTSA